MNHRYHSLHAAPLAALFEEVEEVGACVYLDEAGRPKVQNKARLSNELFGQIKDMRESILGALQEDAARVNRFGLLPGVPLRWNESCLAHAGLTSDHVLRCRAWTRFHQPPSTFWIPDRARIYGRLFPDWTEEDCMDNAMADLTAWQRRIQYNGQATHRLAQFLQALEEQEQLKAS